MSLAKTELQRLVDQFDDRQAEDALEALRAHHFDTLLANVAEVETDELDQVDSLTEEDIRTAVPLDAEFKRRMGVN